MCVLNPKHKLTAVVLGKEIIVESSAESTDVEVTCRTWCEADSDWRDHTDSSVFGIQKSVSLLETHAPKLRTRE